MDRNDFLTYSANEPMTILRNKYNNGESLYKATPITVSQKEALLDVAYLRYVIEEAYSGYTFHNMDLFDDAFTSIEKTIQNSAEHITINDFIDLIANSLSFICDGHLSLTSESYGKGFYKKLQSYVSDIQVKRENNSFVCVQSGKCVEISDNLCAFPTIPNGEQARFLLGIRSKNPINEIGVVIDSKNELIPVHKIASKEAGQEIRIKEDYLNDLAIITCSTFVGNTEDYSDMFYQIGKKCRAYKHVIWDLSNNLGGNSALPEHFLRGLNGWCIDSSKILELHSTLVHAKECGEIKEIPYHFECLQTSSEKCENLYTGTLHVIINDRVASSAESAIMMAKSLPNVQFYGCNSMGIGRFGDLCIYYLPYSRITMWCPQKVFDSTIEETVGYAPDMWIDSKDTLHTIIQHIQQK